MGQPAYCNGYARFDTYDNACAAAKKLSEWSNEQQKNKDIYLGAFNIHVDGAEGVQYVVESSHYGNCVWQCERVRDFLCKLDGCVSIEQDVLKCEDSINWFKEDDEP
jgi:hypothetical protein